MYIKVKQNEGFSKINLLDRNQESSETDERGHWYAIDTTHGNHRARNCDIRPLSQ